MIERKNAGNRDSLAVRSCIHCAGKAKFETLFGDGLSNEEYDNQCIRHRILFYVNAWIQLLIFGSSVAGLAWWLFSITL